MTPAPVLVLFAHPALEKSRVHRVLARSVRELDSVTFHDLYEAYPNFHIDVPREQELLARHELIVFQHPMFWYSTPAILKQWQDLVLEHGWAYGRGGTALTGKRLLCALTTGGSEAAYQHEGMHGRTLRELLAPLEQTAKLCKMEFLPPFVIHGVFRIEPREIEAEAAEYVRCIRALQMGELDIDRAKAFPRINERLDEIIRGSEAS